MARRSGSVRMGPISLFALVIIVCLAVMAVLALVTAHAALARSERQAASVSALYINERAGQELLASLDGELAALREADADRDDALDRLSRTLPELAADAADAAAATDTTADTQAPAVELTAVDSETATVSVRLVADDARALDIQIGITDDLTCEVLAWKASALWTEDTSDTVWQGPA